MTAHPLDIPDWLRRDANKRAPWMGTKEFHDDMAAWLSPEDSPPAKAPNWVPPWEPTTCFQPASPPG